MPLRFDIMSPRRFRGVCVCLLVAALECATVASSRVFAAQTDAAQAKASIQQRLNRIGSDLFSRPDRVNESIEALKEVLAIDPRSAQAHLLLGIAYRMLGSAELMGEAKAELRQALSIDPGFVPARFYLARVYLDLGRAERARAELEAALVQQPGHPQFLALLGESERQLKNPQRSVQLIQQALKADESAAEARYYLGLALLDLGQHDEAIGELERVVQSGAKQVELFSSLGAAYIEAGRFDDALTALSAGTHLDPSRPDLRIQLARAYRSKGLLDEAEEQLKIATPAEIQALASPYQQQQVEFDRYLEQGLIMRQRGRLGLAAEAFQKVLDMDPDHGPANRDLAEVYLLQGSYKLSSEHAARAAKLGFPLPEESSKALQEKLRGKGTGKRK